ncbi:FAD-dependent monooxygenase [Starkeya koreensis]|uniref:FAD-dependent monooxygenase n=1 Tax=Ancylobacter koreensis TaxID=266121 RepID=A0ABT0DLJ5_9HYPH|nr:FAD-dependent monooxygenase [Ancylobacter koreensis]MCK0208151.1 FAD-dependent monooxygenase [Ancylobacter koreensis]
MKSSVDVLIVGAGPVGLFLAADLSRDGLDVLLIDRMAERTFFTKALGITARSLELFDDFGIAQDAVDAGTWLHGISNFTDGVAGPTMDIPDVLPFGSLSLAQFEVERILEACLVRHGGKVHYGWTLAGFAETGDGVRAELTGPDGSPHVVESRFIVGCDGGRSTVRTSLGLDFEGGQFPQTFVLADLEIGWDLPRGRFYRFNVSATAEHAANALAAVPVAGSVERYRLSAVLPDSMLRAAEGERPQPPGFDEIRAMMTPMLPAGTVLKSMHWSSVYRVNHRLVSSYSKGRAFLAGDAAHLHPPVGGQGLNTGLQDAYNLAWKLALALDGRDAPGLLDSYSAERRAVGLDLVENTSRALNETLAQRSPLPGMRETQLLISYRGSAIVRDERADAAGTALAAGDRIPDAGGLRRAYVRLPFRLHERLGRGRHVLFGYAGDEAGLTALVELSQAAHAALGPAVSAFAVVAGDSPLGDREDIPVLRDGEGGFAEAFEAKTGTVWLARPDGYLGWVGDTSSMAGLKAALALIAGR